MQNRRVYFDTSPISYATIDKAGTRFLLIHGTNDDIADPASQSQAFQVALNQAGNFVRRIVIPGAGHVTVIQNTPNPFNPWTTVPLQVGIAGHVTLSVYNAIGEKVLVPFDGDVATVNRDVPINAESLPSGVYRYVTIWTNGERITRDEKVMMVVK